MTPREVVSLIVASTRWPDRLEPWSLAELRINNSQLDRLIFWCAALTETDLLRAAAGLGDHINIDRERIGGQAANGITLLLAFSEIARRDATEGRLWNHVRRCLTDVRGERSPLFDAGGQPTATTKLLLERGARRFGVRHAFDLIDHDGSAHHWYTTVFLQFGITRKGFAQNASYWLRNQNLSRSIRLLLDREESATGSGRPLFSSDFEQFWMTLLLAARKNISGDELRRRLAASYWIPAEDVESIAEQLEVLDWSAFGDDHVAERTLEDDTLSDTFIGAHRWTLTEYGPSVIAELSGLATLELDAPYYDVVIDGTRAARLISSDGELRLLTDQRFQVLGSLLAFRLPQPLRPSMHAALLDPQGAARAFQELQLWPSEEAVTLIPVQAFHVIGPDPALHPHGSKILVVADSSLDVRPGGLQLEPLDNERFFCAIWDRNSGQSIELLLGNAVIWSSDATPAPQDTCTRGAAISVTLASITPIDACTRRASLAVQVQDGLSPVSIWAGRFLLDTTPHHARYWTTETSVSRDCYELDLVIVLRSTTGGLLARRARVDLPLSGFFRSRKGRLESCPPTRSITRASLSEGRYVFLPESQPDDDDWSRNDWTLFEGTRPLARMPQRGQPRLAPLGLGWPLAARYRPVNAEQELLLAHAIVDFGDLRAGHDLSLDEDGVVTLGLHDSLIDQLDQYAFVLWDSTGAIVSGEILEVESSARGYTTVRGLPSTAAERPVAIGLTYRGYRAGTVWVTTWDKHLRNLAEQSAERAALFIRWLQLPVATPHAATAIRHELLYPHPIDTIRGLTSSGRVVTDDGECSLSLADAGLQQPGALDTPWYSALRTIADHWLPEPELVQDFIDGLIAGIPSSRHQPTPLIAAISSLVRVSPRLAVGTAYRYAKAVGDVRLCRSVLEDLARHIADAESDRELHETEQILLEQAAGTLGTILRQPVDPMFVDSLIQRAVAPSSWMGTAWAEERCRPSRSLFEDSQLLCQFPDGRRLLTIRGALVAGGSRRVST